MVIERLRWLIGGAILAVTARWAWLAWRDRPRPMQLRAVDPETGLTLRIALTPAEIAAARERERTTELVG